MATNESAIKDIEFTDTLNDEEISEEIPKEVRVLQTQAYDKSVSDLVAMINGQDIILDPDYQRNYIWDNKKASLLIESILLNVPIQVIYVAEDKDSKRIVVDGLQRLNTLRRFFSNEFKLMGLEVLSELNKLQFSKLNPKAQRVLKNGIIRISVILQESHPEIKYDIFLRLNRGSVKLNEQELRNCLFRGKFNEFLKSLREDKAFLLCMGLSKPHPRFDDAELILRYLALSHAFNPSTGKVAGYQNKMKTFLNNYMAAQRDIADNDLEKLKGTFIDTVNKVYFTFGENAFRRVSLDGSYDSRINRALMDVIMISFELTTQELIHKHKSAVLNLYREIQMEDMMFIDAILYGTSDTRKLEYRLDTWLKRMNKVMQG